MRLLVVGRLSGQLATAVKMAMAHGAKVSHVERGDQATEQLRRGQGADLLMVDYRIDIAALIAANEAERIHVPVVACGVDADASDAAAAIRAGAKEFIPLPPEADLIAAVLSAVADDDRPLISADPSMKAVIMLADQVARSEASILITGESGVGKEVMARYLHAGSKRAERPFISVNCAAIPETLIESELFGYEKGAFTGATSNRMGLIEAAHNSTLFLDEIGELPLAAQARLLRFIQEGEIRRIGAIKSTKVNIRLICATHRRLDELAQSNAFRQDLYYRINVLRLDIPPLRERGPDIAAMANWFATQLADKLDMPPRAFSKNSLEQIVHHPWPGNVRELQNAVERALVMCDDSLLALDLPVGLDQPESTITPDRGPEKRIDDSADELSLEDYFQRFVLQHQDAMNETELAQKLGISRKSLWERRQRFGMPRTKPKAGDSA